MVKHQFVELDSRVRFPSSHPILNVMTDKEILEKVKKLTRPTYDRLKNWAHGWVHIENVARASKKLAQEEGADVLACQIAAYCHDLGRLEEEKRKMVNPKPGSPSAHAVFSVNPAEKILDEVGIAGKRREDIIEAIKLHNIRKYEGPNIIFSILQDADRSDGFTKIAILRFAIFNVGLEISKPKDRKETEQALGWIDEQLKNDPEKARKMIEVLEFAIGWYENLLNFKSSAKLYRNGYLFIKKYRDDLKKLQK